jgi:hypothetical protein
MSDVIGPFTFRFDHIDLIEDPGASLGMDQMVLHSD